MTVTTANESDQIKNEVVFDDVLASAGEWGRYQWYLFFSSCPFFAFGVCAYYSQMFITEVSPNHWCRIPELENLSDFERRDLGIPKDDSARFGYSQCEMYSVNWTFMLEINEKSNKNWDTVPCKNGWEFNKSEIPYPTIGSDLGWVCERQSYQAIAQAIFFVGCMFGGIIFGWIADRFGRVPAITSSCLVGCLGGFCSVYVTNYIEFTAARFVMGMSYDSCMVMAYILILEFVAPKYRTLLANAIFAIFFSLFATALPWVALACKHWKTFGLITSLPLGLGVFTKLLLPESPRWLISKGRLNEAIENVLDIGKINKINVPEELISKFKQSVMYSKTEDQPYLQIFKRPVLRHMYILMCLEYMCSACVFDGVVRCIALLNYDYFISFTAISFSIFPSVILVALIMDHIGRRWMCIVSFCLCSIFFILIIFATTGLLSLIFLLISTVATNVLYSTLLQWPAEVLPSSVRGSGVAVIHISGYIGTVLSPYIAYLKVYYNWLPFVVFSAASVLGMLIAVTLPETAMMSMPNTFEEAEEVTKNQRIWSLPYLEVKKLKKKQVELTNKT